MNNIKNLLTTTGNLGKDPFSFPPIKIPYQEERRVGYDQNKEQDPIEILKESHIDLSDADLNKRYEETNNGLSKVKRGIARKIDYSQKPTYYVYNVVSKKTPKPDVGYVRQGLKDPHYLKMVVQKRREDFGLSTAQKKKVNIMPSDNN